MSDHLKSKDKAARRGTSLDQFTREVLHTSPRGVVEFLIVAATFSLADPTPASLAIGGTLSVTGELLRLAAAGYGYNVGELSLRGPYRFVRHPYFLGSTLLFLGLCVASRHPWLTGVTVVALTMVYGRAYRRDEAKQARRLGPAFADWRARVPAFVPQLIPAAASSPDNHGFSLEYAVLRGRHRELDALLGLAAALGLLWLCSWMTAKDLFHLGVLATVGVYLTCRFVYYGVIKRRGRTKS